jgi:hypothetical protein
MDKVRAKFWVEKIEDAKATGRKGEPLTSVHLRPVAGGGEENDRFYGLTPGGSAELLLVSPETAAFFEQGAQYYLDFTRAPKGG